MRQMMIWGTALSVLLTSLGCRKKPAASAPAPGTPQVVGIDSPREDLQITPLGAGYDEMAAILGVYRWRFHIVCHPPNAQVLHTISLRDKGQWVKDLAGGVSRRAGSGRDEQMVVALYPMDGDLSTSDRLKTFVRVGGATFSRVGDNPLKGRHGITNLPVATRQKDGSYLLLQSSDNGPDPNENARQLVLKFSVTKTDSTPLSAVLNRQ